MKELELSDSLKKNLLDVHYHKNLQYFNTTIIIIFTYFIGIAIAFLTKQINYNDNKQMILVAFISITILSILTLLLLKFRKHLINIPKEIKKLKI